MTTAHLLPTRPPAGAPSHAPDRLSSVTAGGRSFARSRLIGRRIRATRKAAKLTLHELEEISGWSASLIGYLELGQRGMNPRVLRDLALALGVDPVTFGPRMWLAARTGPHVVGRCYESGWSWEEVAA